MTTIPDRLAAALSDRYRIERELGRGGMATVYLAEDLRHQRKVALKVLDPELAAVLGAERFLAEIRTTANLQHPHILGLFDSGAVEGSLFYVMPFVEGESLRDRLTREKQLPVEDAVRIAREVADALQYAHEHGVIHRDIKPENIMLQGGHALVADFGIALAVQTAGGQRMTQTGLSLGTPQYMSPEQAMGDRSIDARSDVYALGAVTYEMLVGEPPFTGATVQSIVAKVMSEKPTAPRTVRDTVPVTVEVAVLKALAKLPADRFVSAAAFAAVLGHADATTARVVAVPARRVSLLLPMAILGIVAAASFLVGRLTSGSRAESGMTFGPATQVTWEPGLEVTPAISPDGKQVAYAKGNGTLSRIFVRPVSGGRPLALTGDSTAIEAHPEWSHDGARILFIRNGDVYSVPSGGGTPKQEVPSRGTAVESATWSPDESRIAYVVGESLFVREATGASRPLTRLFQPSLCTWGAANLIACQAGNLWYLQPGMAFANLAPSHVAIVDPESGAVTGVTDSTSSNVAPQWSPDGHSIYYISNRLGPQDLFNVEVRNGHAGPSHRLTVGLGASSFTLSADGSRIAYAVMVSSSNVWSEPFPRAGAPQRTQITQGQQLIESVAVSRDGQWLYYDSDIAGNTDLYRVRLTGGEPERLTTDRSAEFAPSPSPDGRSVAFHSWRTTSREIYVMPLDGGPVVQLTDTPLQEQNPQWSPDGTSLAFASQSPPLGLFIAHRSTDGTWTSRQRLEAGHWAAWSPDGRFLSYSTLLGGLGGLRVVPADSGAPRTLVDETAPGAPGVEVSRWSQDGRTIYFKSHDPDGEGVLWSIPAAGGTPTRIMRFGDGRQRSDRYGFWFANGRIYYTLYDRQANVWVVDVR